MAGRQCIQHDQRHNCREIAARRRPGKLWNRTKNPNVRALKKPNTEDDRQRVAAVNALPLTQPENQRSCDKRTSQACSSSNPEDSRKAPIDAACREIGRPTSG